VRVQAPAGMGLDLTAQAAQGLEAREVDAHPFVIPALPYTGWQLGP
jgi:hypothetical protein